jgi:WD40 repeat protein/tRNA A-37 threonylcarbamoyl transferase component Bud32
VLERFEDAWRSGQPPVLEHFLADAQAERRALLVELVHEDLEYRHQAGEAVRVETYLQRFSELRDERAIVMDLIASEYARRRMREPSLGVAEYLQRFPEFAEGLAAHLEQCAWRQGLGRPVCDRFDEQETAPPSSRAASRASGETAPPTSPGPLPEPAADGPLAMSGYEILGELGRGGMGVVYKARHLQLRRTVALKMILHGAHAGREELARFRSEAEAIARVQHPNLVQIYEIGEHNGLPFFALEFVEGGGLDHQLQGNPQPPEQAAQVVETLGRAMQVAHEAGVVHRDLKPANVLLGKGGVVKITDFGLAKRLDAPGLTASGAVMGTPSYMAPEQAGQSKAIGPAADVYALGAILYELLTGRPPFRAATPMDTLLQVLGEDPVPPSRLNPKVPCDLETVCLKCLEKDPGRRYGSAEALARDLGHWRAGKPISARPVSRVERLWRWCLRNRAVASLLAAVGLVLVGGVVGVAVALLQTNAALEREKESRGRADAALGREKKALEASQDNEKKLETAMARLTENLSELANIYCVRSRHELENGNVGDSVSWMLRAYEVAPADDPLRRNYRVLLADRGQSPDVTLLHSGPVAAVAFSPDGRTLLTGSFDKTARLWDAATSQARGLPLRHEDEVWAVAFSPDGRTVLTGSKDRTARLWDGATGQPRGQPLRHENEVKAVAFSPDGRTVITGSFDKTARLWDAATGKPLGQPPLRHEGGVTAVAYSPDGRIVLTGCLDGTARLWDAATGRLRGQPLRGEPGPERILFTREGRPVLTASTDKTAGLSEVVAILPRDRGGRQTDPVWTVAFSPDGRTVLTGGKDGTARLWDAATGRPRGQPLRHGNEVRAVAFSPDGRIVVTGGTDKTVRLWDLATGRPLGQPPLPEEKSGPERILFTPEGRTVPDAGPGPLGSPSFRHEDSVLAVAFSPDGRTMLTGCRDKKARLWDATTGHPYSQPLRHKDEVWAVAISPDGHTVLTGSQYFEKPKWKGEARLWDAGTGQPRGQPLRHDNEVRAVAFSPDGRTVLTGSFDKTARLWDAATGKPVGQPPLRHEGGVTAAAYSPDGRMVLTGCLDGTARLWDQATGRLRGQPLRPEREFRGKPAGPERKLEKVLLTPESWAVLTACSDKTAGLSDAAAILAHDQSGGQSYPVWAVAFSPDGRTVLTDSDDRTARLWDAATGQPRGQPLRHDGPVLAVAFSPDGRTVLTGSEDKTARLWDAATGQARGQGLYHEGGVYAVAFSPDNRMILTGTIGTARLWDAVTGQPLGQPLRHEGLVCAVAFSPNARTVLTASKDKTARIWEVPQIPPDEPARLKAWVHLRTGKIFERGVLRQLSDAECLQEWQRLQSLGGDWQQRRPAKGWHLTQADNAEVKGDWFAAVFHLSRLLAQDGGNLDLRRRLSIGYAMLGQWDKAIANCAEVMGRKP